MNKFMLMVLLSMSPYTFSNEASTYNTLTVALERIRVENDIPAMSVAIITAGEVTYIKGFGFLDEKQTKPTMPESTFRIASISKLFTAQAIMRLVEKNKIDLNERVGRYLPIFNDSDMTVKSLLTHTSGLTDVVSPVNFEHKRSITSYLDLIKQPLLTDINDKGFEYSDTNYNILGAIIRSESEKSFERYIYDNILKPAKMNQSGYFNGENSYLPESKPTYQGKLLDLAVRRPYDPSFNPSEGLISNARDLSRWVKLSLNNDPILLKKQTYETMLVPQVKTSWGQIDMGLGWQVYHSENDRVARHPGSIRGYKSLLLTYPDKKHALILLTNSSNTPRWEIAKSITDILQRRGLWQ